MKSLTLPLRLLACSFLLATLTSACIGDPGSIAGPCEGALCAEDVGQLDANEPDAIGDAEPDAIGDAEPDAIGDAEPDAIGDAEPDADSGSPEPDQECIVPSENYSTLTTAVDDVDCSVIFIRPDQNVVVPQRIILDRDLLFYGDGFESQITISTEGLFRLDNGVTISMESLSINANEEIDAINLIETPAFTLHNEASLTLNDMEISGLRFANQPIIDASRPDAQVTLENTILRDNVSRGGGPVAINCLESTIRLRNSRIQSNIVRLIAPQINSGPSPGALALDNCDFVAETSEVRSNQIRANISITSDTNFLARGAGVFATNNSALQILDDSYISANKISLTLNSLQQIPLLDLQARGAGIFAHNSSLRVDGSTISENQIIFEKTDGDDSASDASEAAASGAGIYVSADQSTDLLIDGSTISENRIDFILGDSFLAETLRATGGGLSIHSTTEDPVVPLKMVNSTVSSNQILGMNEAAGAGIHLSVGTNTLFQTLPQPSQLQAQIRYSTITSNRVDSTGNTGIEATESGSGLVVTSLNSAAPISLIGLLLQNNTPVDCGGSAQLFFSATGISTVRSDAILVSEDSLDPCQSSFDEVGINLGNSIIIGGDANLSPLQVSGSSPTTVHIPDDESAAINAGEQGECSGIDNDPLTVDQRGQSRPVTRCDIGSVEIQ